MFINYKVNNFSSLFTLITVKNSVENSIICKSLLICYIRQLDYTTPSLINANIVIENCIKVVIYNLHVINTNC